MEGCFAVIMAGTNNSVTDVSKLFDPAYFVPYF